MAATLPNLLRQCTAMAVMLDAEPTEVLRAVWPLIKDRELAAKAAEQLPPDGGCQEPRHLN